MKFSSLKFIPALLLFNIFAPAKTEDLMQDFASKENATWDKASYQKITKNQNGEELKIRYFIDKKGNIYEFRRAPNLNLGPTKVGNLNEKKYSEGNTCFFGTNYECLSNITRTTYQYALKDGQLLQFSRTDYLKTNTKGDVNKSILGSTFINYELANSYNETAANYMKRGNYQEAIKFTSKSLGINPKSLWALSTRAYSFSMLENYPNSLKTYNKMTLINPKDAWAHNGKCDANLQLKAYKAALSDCNVALKLTKEKDKELLAYINLNLGVIKYALGDKLGSCENYKFVISNSNLINKENYEKYIESSKDVEWCNANNFI